MEKEQRSRRPRISTDKGVGRDGVSEKYEKVDYSQRASYTPEKRTRFYEDGEQRPYQQTDRSSYGNNGNRPNNNNNNGNRYDSQRTDGDSGNRYGNRQSYNTNSNPRPYNNNNYNRPQRPSYNNDRGTGSNKPWVNRNDSEGGEQRSYNNNYNRPQRPSYNNDRGTGANKPWVNRNDGENRYGESGGERRSYNNNNYNRPQRPSYNNDRSGSSFGRNNDRQGGSQQRGYNNFRGGYNSQGGDRRFQQRRSGDNDSQFRYPVQKRIEYVDTTIDMSEPIRLNKFMANAGICSRREADEFILAGDVKVNGEVKNELGTKVLRTDVITFKDKEVKPEHKVYVLLNKPKDCVTTADDPQGRLTVMDIVRSACSERIYPVGRLDRNTTGVLLLTNDGDLASKLTHPKFVKKKIYHVWTDRDVTEEDMQRIADGIELEDGPIHADAVSYATDIDRNQVGIEIHSGRNRIVRRIFEALGYRVVKLDRVYFAGLTKKNLPRGRWRYLTQEEVNMLNMGSFE